MTLVPRWPERECFHYIVAFRVSLNGATGEVVNSVPAYCVDCGKIFEDSE